MQTFSGKLCMEWNKLAMEMQICAVWLGPEQPAAPTEEPLKGESA